MVPKKLKVEEGDGPLSGPTSPLTFRRWSSRDFWLLQNLCASPMELSGVSLWDRWYQDSI